MGGLAGPAKGGSCQAKPPLDRGCPAPLSPAMEMQKGKGGTAGGGGGKLLVSTLLDAKDELEEVGARGWGQGGSGGGRVQAGGPTLPIPTRGGGSEHQPSPKQCLLARAQQVQLVEQGYEAFLALTELIFPLLGNLPARPRVPRAVLELFFPPPVNKRLFYGSGGSPGQAGSVPGSAGAWEG